MWQSIELSFYALHCLFGQFDPSLIGRRHQFDHWMLPFPGHGAGIVTEYTFAAERIRQSDDWIRREMREPLSLDGVILPGSAEANPYRDNIYSKKGKDGFYRYSVNVFTYFFPVEHHIAVLSCDVDCKCDHSAS